MLLFHCILTFMKDIVKSENQVFNPTRLLVFLYCGVGKDWAVPFFPPSLIFRPSIDRFVFWFMLLFHSILTFMKDLFQSENQVFNPTRLLVLLHCGVGKDWAGPSFPPSKMFGSFYLYSRLWDYVILLLYRNSCLIPSRESSFQTNKFICNCRVGKDWAGPFFPPSLIFRSSIDRFVFSFMLLFHSILTFMKDLYQSENQVFNPTRLLVLLHCWVGKDWAGPFFPPPPKSFDLSIDQVVFPFMLLFHCILTPLNDRFQSFQTKHFICTATLWGGKRLGRPILSPPPSKMF